MNVEMNVKNAGIAAAVVVGIAAISYGSYRLGKKVKVKLAARKATRQDKAEATADSVKENQSKAA